jgi:hypothetical protein
MSLPLKRDPRFHQGTYKPTNPEKFLGKTCVFRSGLELKFFRFCDSNPNVVKWGSECVTVPYYDKVQQKTRTYYIDNYVVIKEGDVLTKYLVEIKPFKQTIEPNPKSKAKKTSLLFEQAQYITNTCKWDAAKQFASKIGAKFIIITEKDLNF